jgi:hypothetical protein
MKPIAWYDPTNGLVSTDKDSPLFTPLGQVLPLYPPRAWVDLTSAEIGEIYRVGWANNMELARAIEAKLKEKNE